MEFLFTANYLGIMCEGDFDIYAMDDGKYLAKMIRWDQVTVPAPPGDIVFWRGKRHWTTTHWHKSIVTNLGRQIAQWEAEN